MQLVVGNSLDTDSGRILSFAVFSHNKKLAQKERNKLMETKRQMLDAIGADAYNGVNLFEGTDFDLS